MIEVRLEKKSGLSASWVRGILTKTLKAERSTMSLNVLVTGDRQIRKINQRYLKHDYVTDVLSFPTGDIVVSVDFAKRYAKSLKLPFKEEMARYLVHGTLHLLGYDDKRKADHKKMHARQESILKRIL